MQGSIVGPTYLWNKSHKRHLVTQRVRAIPFGFSLSTRPKMHGPDGILLTVSFIQNRKNWGHFLKSSYLISNSILILIYLQDNPISVQDNMEKHNNK